MYRRFKNSLFSPSSIIEYRNDRKLTTFLYLVILVLISIIPAVTYLARDNRLDYDDKILIQESFRNVDIPYRINNYKLENVDSSGNLEVSLTEVVKVIFSKNVEDATNPLRLTTVAVIIAEDGVYYNKTLSTTLLFRYSEYNELQNLNFAGATENNKDFWNMVFNIATKEVQNNSRINYLDNFLMAFLGSVFDLLIFSLIITFFQKMSLPRVKFRQYYKLSIYLLTPYVIFSVIGSLYGIAILNYIAIFISVIYAGRLTRKMTSV